MTDDEHLARINRAAVHECGHFVVASILGVKTSEPKIQIDDEGYVGGYCTVETDESPLAHVVMVAIAGHVAEAIGFNFEPMAHVASCFAEDPPKWLCGDRDFPHNDAAKAGDVWPIYLDTTVAIIAHNKARMLTRAMALIDEAKEKGMPTTASPNEHLPKSYPQGES